ncbi:glycerol dehydrogenase [Iodobacter arcticus]|uniref:Glycerol dehydrogenase n=1 Tax=Iodobacter arcticus TaxID=590593 RepID=A0ABW2R0A3_9NEIS
MEKIISSPGKYIQGKGALSSLAKYSQQLGDKALIISGSTVQQIASHIITKSFEEAHAAFHMETFEGECCRKEIDRLVAICKAQGIKVVIGVGGGKTLDTAKAVAHFYQVPVVIVPSIASTDAPTSALSVIYTVEGQFESYLMLPKNPEVVLIDSAIVAQAPARLLVSGMGDALATYFEARANVRSGRPTMAGGMPTQAALALAELCYKTLLKDGLKAKLTVENKVLTPAVENIIEANTYLSGVGFESGGLAAAHAVHNGLTLLSECHHLFHGEKVAFGTLVQLTLENAPLEEINQVLDFCRSVGLPTCLADIGAADVSNEALMAVAKAACAKGETIHNMPFEVDADAVYAAILVANQLGKRH